MMAPKFTHDCDRCIFLGQDAEHDFYFCPSPSEMHTVIARYGNDGPEYLSGLEVARQVRRSFEFSYPLVKALNLAEERGLLKRPDAVGMEAFIHDEQRWLVDLSIVVVNEGLEPPRYKDFREVRRELFDALEKRMPQFLLRPATRDLAFVMTQEMRCLVKDAEQRGLLVRAQ